MDRCPRCNKFLKTSEKAVGQCFFCEATFQPELHLEEEDLEALRKSMIADSRTENFMAMILGIIGAVVIGLGTIGNLILWRAKSLTAFLLCEAVVLVLGMCLFGLAEIIQLLENIKANTERYF